jgi:hypothetical protein
MQEIKRNQKKVGGDVVQVSEKRAIKEHKHNFYLAFPNLPNPRQKKRLDKYEKAGICFL